MRNLNKILLALFLLLLVVVGGEIVYLIIAGQTKTPISKQPIKPSLSKEDLARVYDPYFQSFSPVKYNAEIDRFYYDIPGQKYVNKRRMMGINYASWISISTYGKDQLESSTIINKLRGTISQIDTKKVYKNNGQKYLFFMLTGSRGLKSEYKFSETLIKKMKFVKLFQNSEIPITIEELRNGDIITIEEKLDMTKPPKDANYIIETKLTKL